MRIGPIILLALMVLAGASAPQAEDLRQFYLSPIDGAGTDADPWHSRCLGLPGAGNIDLRPTGINAFLCASDALPADMTGVEEIGASLKSAIGGKKNKLKAKIKKQDIQASNTEDFIAELLTPHLKAEHDGKLKIYLGGNAPVYEQTAWVPFRDHGLVADLGNAALRVIEPPLAWAAIFIDTFTGADNNLAGELTWTEYLATNWVRANNRAEASGITPTAAEARAEHDTSTVNQTIQADMTYTYVSTGNFRCTVIGRKDTSTTRTFYGFGFQRDVGGVDTYRLISRINSTPTTLGDSVSATASSAVIKLSINGTTITGYVNGAIVVGPVTDSSITTNTRGGLAYTGGAAGDACTADNFSVSDFLNRGRGGALWVPYP